MGVELMEYQKELVRNVMHSLNTVGRAGLELFTSGGKSFIAMSVIEQYIKQNHRDILWIAPRAAMFNVQTRYLDKTKYSNRIHYINIEKLSRYMEIFEDDIDYSNIGLIVIDEAHKLMAPNAYEMYKSEIRRFNNISILAMTASSFRNLDGIRSLERLVGEKNIYRYSLGEAIDESIANPVQYYGTSMSYNKGCYMAIEELKDKYGDIQYIRDILNEVMIEMDKLEESFEDRVVNFINSKVHFDAVEGDRHIVFFSRIAELRLKKNSIKSIMEKLYPRNTAINIIEYHGELSQSQANHNIDLINSSPVSNQVDVILTVDKGSESIHPENIRSEIIFRGTQSMVKFTQMTGRVVTLTSQYNQDSYIFDFCNSIKFLGAETIIIGHRRTYERTEANLNRGMTPEELLEDIKNLKKHSNNKRAFNINLDDSLAKLDEIFSRLASMYEIMNNVGKIGNIIKNNLNTIDSKYNGNIAAYIKKEQDKNDYRSYCILQHALLYGSLTQKDKDNIESLEKLYGYRMYLTNSMSNSDIDKVRRIVNIDDRLRGCYDKLYRITQEEREFLYKLSIDFLTETLSTDMEAFIRRNDSLREYLLSRFNGFIFKDLGCYDNLKRSSANTLIHEINSVENGEVSREQWIKWKGYMAFIKHANFIPEYEDKDKMFAASVLKYITNTNDGIYNAKYELTVPEKSAGAKTIRVLKCLYNKTELSTIDELFMYNFLDTAYNESDYVRNIFNAAGYTSHKKLRREVISLTKTHKLIKQFEDCSTENNLMELLKHNTAIALPVYMQQKIMNSHKVKQLMCTACKQGNERLMKYFINRLDSKDGTASTVLKRAALDGAGYQRIITLAFPHDATNSVNIAIDKIRDNEYPDKLVGDLRSTYCVVPFATKILLKNIQEYVLPKNGYKAENEFIDKMIL